MTRPLLDFDHVEVSFDGTSVVHDVSFPVLEGEVVCIVGESGSGKSTLVRAAMGQLGKRGCVTRGDIWYEGESLPDLPARRMRQLCGSDFALVFQDCLASLTPIRRVADQIFEGMSAHRKVSREECDRLASEMFERLGLDDSKRVLASYPFELSGGMGQRVGIAIALLGEPRVLFADEPTSALDVIAQAQVVELLARVNREWGTTIVLVTHNMAVVEAVADHVLVLRDGIVEEFGTVQQVLQAPAAAYTRELISATPRLVAEGE
ncbi:MAG: ABC transporter ATP-binding protein [Atopobiaceae bacterium]|nr:ABC transporter ATP-binding protein [Atopobiaceae bacterium]